MKKLNKNKKLIALISIITIIIIIGVIISANIIKTNIANEKYKSSNENSNNENLIPEYIKKGITLGGVTGTLESLDTSDATAKPEDILLGKTAYVDGKKITGTKITKDVLKIGDYVEYTPDTASTYSIPKEYSGYTINQSMNQENLKWRILSVNNDGTVDLISDKETDGTLLFDGPLGYNNIVYYLNDICAKQYSNKELGLTARSIRLEDIEGHFTAEGIDLRNEFAPYDIKYGDTLAVSNKDNRYYPKIASYENGLAIDTDTIKTNGIKGSDSYYTSPTKETYSVATNIIGTQTFGSVRLNTTTLNSEEFYKLICTSDSYYVATRCINCYGDGDAESHHISYKIYWIYSNAGTSYALRAGDLLSSYTISWIPNGGWSPIAIRPVVTVKANIEFVNGNGSLENPYKLKR